MPIGIGFRMIFSTQAGKQRFLSDVETIHPFPSNVRGEGKVLA